MKKLLLLFLVTVASFATVAQTATINTPPTPTTVVQGETFTISGSFDAGTGDSVKGNLAFVLRLYDTTDETFVFVKNALVNKDGIQSENDVISPNIVVPASQTPSADLAENLEYRVVVSYQRTVGGNYISTTQVITITEGPNIKYTTLPTEISSITGLGLGKGALKTIVTWTNVTPGNNIFNQLKDTNGDQVGGLQIPVTRANGSSEINWGYFGSGTLVAGTNATINSQYAGVSSLSSTVPIVNTITRWSGATDTRWNEAGNWDNGLPNATLKAVIPNVFNKPIIDTSADALDITVQDGSSLTINSDKSLIVTGNSDGNVTYKRNIPTTTNWYQISSPVIGQDIDLFAAAEPLATGVLVATNRGIGTYNNGTSGWDYYQDGSAGTGNFASGSGKILKLTAAQDITFTGTLLTTDITDLALTKSGSNGFNLIGNPTTAYLNTDVLLTTNSGLLSEETIWIWNGTTYDDYGSSDSFKIAPGQGFFVSASAAASNFNISEMMQVHNGSDTFQKQQQKTKITLTISNNDLVANAKVLYTESATTSFDNGHDRSVFGGVNTDVSLYTQLLTNNTGKKLATQSLPNSSLEAIAIPVGVKAAAGEITFSAETLNLPSGVKVYLEDKQENTFTRLDIKNANYKVLLPEDLDGIGRFFVHTASKVLSVNDNSILTSLSIYKSNATTLRLIGLPQGKTTVSLYNIIGKKVMLTQFNTNGNKEISLPNLAPGIYVAKVQTEKGRISKKIILE